MPTSAAQPSRAKPAGPSGSMKALPVGRFGYEQARHLLWRAGLGGTPAQIRTLADWGPERSVDYLLNAGDVPFDGEPTTQFSGEILRPPTEEERRFARQARATQDEEALARLRLVQQERERKDRAQMREIQRWWLKRMIQTPRPLEERMVLFWHGHFATSFRTVENSYHMLLQNALFRRHALGNFGDLLLAIIRDPAMIAYLDNNDSRKGRPNENLARELMELFSLGVGNYTERDIKEGARALTGYTFDHNAFVFRQNAHDDGMKTILGRSGRLNGDDFVKTILAQPACSRFIARKLYACFAADLPPDIRSADRATRDAVDILAASLRASNYDLKPALRRLFLSEHFYDQHIVGQQIKSPVQLVVGAVRSLLAPVRDLSILTDALDLMGQNLFHPPSVKGWDGGRSWINTSTLFVRQNLLNFLLTGKRPQGYDPMADAERYDPQPLLAELAAADPGAERDPERTAEYLLRFTLGRAPTEATTTLADFVRNAGGQVNRETVTGMLLLITAMPEYQLC